VGAFRAGPEAAREPLRQGPHWLEDCLLIAQIGENRVEPAAASRQLPMMWLARSLDLDLAVASRELVARMTG
jgi:hypothetical protein